MSAPPAAARRAPRRRALRPLLLVPLLAAAGTRAAAQAPGTLRVGAPAVEGRVDLLAGRATSAHAGLGVTWPVGRYVRLGPVAGGGVTHPVPTASGADDAAASARVELVARFVVEPADGRRWRYYAGAGGGVLLVRGVRGQARVHVVVGADAPPVGRVRPGVELGVGGGVRVGLVLRQVPRPR